jgi:hypothetical protein
MAQADVPDPQFCSVTPWDSWEQAFVTPGQQSNADEITIVVHNNADLPIDAADVELDFSGCANRCEGTAGLSGQTAATGELVLNPEMGGCEDCTIIVRANGVTIATYGRMVSTDWNGASCSGDVEPTDLSFFAAAFNVTGELCADYNNDGVDPADLSKFANSFNSGDAN